MNTKYLSKCYLDRFPASEKRARYAMWKVLCENLLQQFVSRSDTLMDIGAGDCEFINNINCETKIAVDLNPNVKKMAHKNVILINRSIFNIGKKFNGSIDVIFLSNFLEHLNSKDQVLEVLNIANKLLAKNGRIILLQPNIDLIKEAYWDFIDHKTALNTKSIEEALRISGFEIKLFIKKFLPYTTKSYLPISTFLLKIYLKIPQVFKPFAGQSLVVATKQKKYC